jgi:hypothetical protein
LVAYAKRYFKTADLMKPQIAAGTINPAAA